MKKNNKVRPYYLFIEIKELIDINVATISSTYNTKNYVILDVKNDYTEELDNFIEEKSFDLRNYIVSKMLIRNC